VAREVAVTSMVSALSSCPTHVEAALHPEVLAVAKKMLVIAVCLSDIVRVTAGYPQCSRVSDGAGKCLRSNVVCFAQ